jgi:hypothetical protein
MGSAPTPQPRRHFARAQVESSRRAARPLRTGRSGLVRLARLGLTITVLALVGVGAEFWALAGGHEPALSHQYSTPAGALAPGAWSWPTTEGAPIAIRESSYRLSLERKDGIVTVLGPQGASLFSFPLTALIGRARIPEGAHFVATTTGSRLDLYTFSGGGMLLERALVQAHPGYFTLSFEARRGRDRFAAPTFLYNGSRGLPLSFLSHAFSPDPVSPSLQPTPTTYLGVHHPFHTAPFAPPPFQLSFKTGANWTGAGLVQVPDATVMALTRQGGIYVNYPLARLASIRDQGAGGRVAPPAGVPEAPDGGTWLGFPSLVFTFGATPAMTLLSYHLALQQMGEAPLPPGAGHPPRWWSWPMVDTWGQQLVVGAARTSRKYTAAWVEQFVNTWRQRFGVRHFTVILDSQWQARLGFATPSARFGGATGMRQLIERLHAEGLKVVLWWPLWKQQSPTGRRTLLDPTAPAFPKLITSQMNELLGSGPADLGADGLKLDWGFLIPPPTAERISRPQLGIGAALLLRYMRLLSGSAWQANPGALIDASAVAPQFGGTEDTLRLYDAARASTWSYRAAIVSAVDPDRLIDGDGWHLDRSQAVAHTVESAVFGIPAMYYATRWSGGTRIPKSLARALGSVLSLGQQRGQGGAARLEARGRWTYEIGGRVTATTLAGSTALAVYHYSRRGRLTGATVVSALTTRVQIPPLGREVPERAADPGGGPVRYRRLGAVLQFTARAGDRYVVTFGPRARGGNRGRRWDGLSLASRSDRDGSGAVSDRPALWRPWPSPPAQT